MERYRLFPTEEEEREILNSALENEDPSMDEDKRQKLVDQLIELERRQIINLSSYFSQGEKDQL